MTLCLQLKRVLQLTLLKKWRSLTRQALAWCLASEREVDTCFATASEIVTFGTYILIVVVRFVHSCCNIFFVKEFHKLYANYESLVSWKAIWFYYVDIAIDAIAISTDLKMSSLAVSTSTHLMNRWTLKLKSCFDPSWHIVCRLMKNI